MATKTERRVVERGKPLTELVKGSYNYTMHAIRRSFSRQFDFGDDMWVWVEEIFDGYVIVYSNSLEIDEYYFVTYERGEDNSYVFAPFDDWEIVELAYQPQTQSGAGSDETSEDVLGEGKDTPDAGEKPASESKQDAPTRKQQFKERLDHAAQLEEAKTNKPRVLKAKLAQADVINGNSRRYPRAVIREAVQEARTHLHESLSQGRAILLGEAEHPTDKRQGPRVLETILVWQDIWFDEGDGWVKGEAHVIETSIGRDVIVLMDAGVLPGVSLRGYGESKLVEEDGQEIEEVQWLRFTGFDLVLNPGFQDAAVEVLESMEEPDMGNQDPTKEKETTPAASPQNGQPQVPSNMEELRKQNPDLYKQIVESAIADYRQEQEAQAAEQNAKKAAAAEKHLREALGIGPDDDLEEAVRKDRERREKLEARERQREVEAHIAEASKTLTYPSWLQEQVLAYVNESKPETVEEVDAAFESAKKIFGPLAARGRMAQMGFSHIDDIGPVIEREAGVPEFARAAFEITETMVMAGLWTPRDKRPRNRNLTFTEKYLERYDELFQHQLQTESARWSEAMLQTQLGLPYTVLRAIIDEAFPQLIATSIFDTGVVTSNPTRIYYEAFFQAESGYEVTVSAEDVTSDEGAWVNLAGAHIVPGSVNVEPNGGGSAFAEGTDYVVDYLEGRLMALASGSIGDATALDVDYVYHAVRKGEGQGIERARSGLRHTDLTLTADRLATEISDEAITFSRSQLGYDAVTRTLNLLTKELMRNIDNALFGVALAEALRVANNSGGTWNSASDDEADLVKALGVAKVKVENRNYTPTFILMSNTNADRVSNWDGFSNAGDRPDADLDVNGYVGRLKGLPVFRSTNFPDGYIMVGNREHIMYRTFGDMQLRGPYPTYDSNGLLVANEQYYLQEYNGCVTPIREKASYVVVS